MAAQIFLFQIFFLKCNSNLLTSRSPVPYALKFNFPLPQKKVTRDFRNENCFDKSKKLNSEPALDQLKQTTWFYFTRKTGMCVENF